MELSDGRPSMVDVPTLQVTQAEPLVNATKDALKDIVFGSIAGIVGKFIEYPFDTVKVRLQSQSEHSRIQYKGPLDCFQQSLRRDGFLGLYRGISAPLFGAAVENSCLFFSYRLAQKAIAPLYRSEGDLPFSGLCVCGAGAGAFTSLFLTPIELIKCKMQVPLETGGTLIRSPGPLQLIASVWRHQGVLGFWRGQMGTFIRETGGGVAWFGSYEGVSLFFRQRRSDPSSKDPLLIWQQMAAGAAAGMSYNFMFYPADTIKSRMQTEDVSQKLSGGRQSFAAVGKLLWQQQGLKGLYRGCGLTVARSAPSSAFIFTVYESLRRTFE